MNITSSKAVRIKMMELCDEHFSWNIDGNNELIHQYIMPDGTTISLTAEAGEKESASYKSQIWDYWKLFFPNLVIRKDYEGNAGAFTLHNNSNEIINHENIIDVFRQGIKEEYILSSRPRMLPNAHNLDLSYFIECDYSDRPIFWPLKEKG